MDTHPQDPNTISENRVDSDAVMEPQSSQNTQPHLSLPGTPDPHVEAKAKKLPLMTEDAKGAEGPNNETEAPKEV